jgi:hypothetical protein
VLHDSVFIAGDRKLDQVLEPGHVVTLVVHDPSGTPVAGADLDVKAAGGGDKIFTPHDMTIADGTAVAVLQRGTYLFQIDPPPGTPLDRAVLNNVAITADTTIAVSLPEAIRVTATGQVVDEFGTGVEGVELKARLKINDKPVFIPNPFTDPLGGFVLAIPIGLYNVFVSPPRGAKLIAVELPGVEVAADSSWGVTTLKEGVLVFAEVRSPSGAVISGADLDVVLESTQETIFTPHDNTDANNAAEAVLAPDTYTFIVTPPTGSPYEMASLNGLVITRDTTIVVNLATAPGNVPVGGKLGNGHPNPFRSATTVPYTVLQASDLTVGVYNVAGQLVRVLASGFHPADTYETTWDGRDRSGARVSSGVYFVRLNSSSGKDTRKVILIR